MIKKIVSSTIIQMQIRQAHRICENVNLKYWKGKRTRTHVFLLNLVVLQINQFFLIQTYSDSVRFFDALSYK